MTFQFKVRSKENMHEQCEKQINLLKDYNRAIEKQNQSRNEQRKALQAQIERLRMLQRDWKQRQHIIGTHTISISDNKDFTELKQQHYQIKNKYQKLLLENSTLTTRIISAELTNNRLLTCENQKKTLNQNIKNHTTKISLLEAKVLNYQREINELKIKQESNNPIIRQYQTTSLKIQELQKQLRLKNDQISRQQRQAATKQEQLSSLKRQISNYSLKIDTLSEELAKIQRIQKVQIRYIEREDTLALRGKLQQLNNINGSLAMELNSLQIQKGNNLIRIKDLQKRIMILQQTNYSLQNQLKLAIQTKRPTVQIQQDHTLKEAVYSLKQQLQQVRNFNHLVRQQNDELYQQLQIYKSNYCRCNHHSHHHRKSKSPIKSQLEAKTKSKLQQQHSALQKIAHNHSHYSVHHHRQSKLLQTQGNFENKVPYESNKDLVSERYNDLQRKIQQLQTENQVLKKHLVHQI